MSEIPTDIKSSVECFPEDLILISAATGCPSSNCNGVLDLHEGFDHIRVLTLERYGPRNAVLARLIYYIGIDHGKFKFNNKFLKAKVDLGHNMKSPKQLTRGSM